MQDLNLIIDAAFERRAEITPTNVERELLQAIDETMELLDTGKARVAEKRSGEWIVNQWLKKAVLLYFRTHDNAAIDGGYTRFFDKVPLKHAGMSDAEVSYRIANGLAGTPMPAFAASLTEQERRDLVSYLHQRWGSP